MGAVPLSPRTWCLARSRLGHLRPVSLPAQALTLVTRCLFKAHTHPLYYFSSPLILLLSFFILFLPWFHFPSTSLAMNEPVTLTHPSPPLPNTFYKITLQLRGNFLLKKMFKSKWSSLFKKIPLGKKMGLQMLTRIPPEQCLI